MNIKKLPTNRISLDYPVCGVSRRKDYPRGTDKFRALMDILRGHIQHQPAEVIEAIDTLLDDHYKGKFKQEIGDALQFIKWSSAYSTYITNPDAELSVNPGFYADCILYRGLVWTRERKDVGLAEKVVSHD